MIALWLIAAHMVGDFVVSTRWQAAAKLDDAWVRARHVAFYSLPFYVVLAVFWPGVPRAAAFLVCLLALHFLTDSRRFASTLGDVIGWWAATDDERIAAHERPNPHGGTFRPGSAAGLRLPPNPWPPIPLFIDQTLHLVQLAVLGTVFLQ